MLTLTANIAGSDLGRVAGQVDKAIKRVGEPPPKVSAVVRGQIVPMQEMLAGLRTGLLLAIVVIFLLLAANFESLKLSVIVVSTIPAVIAGVALMLWLTRTTLNIQSFMGAIMAIGVAVSNAILLVTFAERARMAGAESVAAAPGEWRRALPAWASTRRPPVQPLVIPILACTPPDRRESQGETRVGARCRARARGAKPALELRRSRAAA